MFNFLKKDTKKTNYLANGLILKQDPKILGISVDKQFDPMPYFDRRVTCLAVDNQGNVPSCFPGDEEVLMEDLSWKQIRNIKIGDRVISSDGQPHLVTHLSKKLWQGTLYHIKVTGSYKTINCTPKHPILVIEKAYKDDQHRKPKDNEKILVWKMAKEVKDGDYVATIGPNCRTINTSFYSWEDDVDFWWLVGLYCAEGCLHNNSEIVFCLNINEEEYKTKIDKIAQKYGRRIAISKKPLNNSMCISITDSCWFNWFLENCKKGAEDKKLSTRIMMMPGYKCQSLLNGWFNGDGHKRGNDYTATTISKIMARQMRLLMLKCGLICSLRKRKERKERRQAWDVSWTMENTKTVRGFWYNNLYFSRVSEVSYDPAFYGGNVYNLEVADTHDYIIDYYCVHNCASHTCANYLETEFWLKNGYKQSFDALAIYKEAKIIDGSPNSEGTTLEAVIQAAQNLNVLSLNITLNYIKNIDELKFALYKGCVLGGFRITDGWNKVKMNGEIGSGSSVLGGHGVLITLYDDINKRVGICNQWGNGWGCQYDPFRGHAYLSYDQFAEQLQYGIAIQYS